MFRGHRNNQGFTQFLETVRENEGHVQTASGPSSFLLDAVDVLGFLLLPFIGFQILNNLFNFVTFSNDYLTDVNNYLNLPKDFLAKNGFSYAFGAHSSEFLESLKNSLMQNPFWTKRVTQFVASTQTQMPTAPPSAPSAVVRTLTASAQVAAATARDLSTHTIVFKRKNAIDLAWETRNGDSFIVLNSLLLKVSNAYATYFPFLAAHVRALKIVSLGTYFAYALTASIYMVLAFASYIVCSVVNNARMWDEIYEFVLHCLCDDLGVL